MSNGKAKKQVNERSNLLKQALGKRYQSLNNRIDRARKELLGRDELIQLRAELENPVQLSNSLVINLGDCHPGTGIYKRVMPKGYLTDLAMISKQIEQTSVIAIDHDVLEPLAEEPELPALVQEKIDPPVIVPVFEDGEVETLDEIEV